MVAAELYGGVCPVVLLAAAEHARLADAEFAAVEAGKEGAVVRVEEAPV
jgi:hypothetical protein